ncbi:MAG: adenosylcobinamide-GDP ribazoletransferase [Clostridia bacterium]|nr:adenosylcobinamide-GDP ribazoletransferase [Clostridia bacterium]MBQ8469002.1 adenosylcobinamide-GDP ribazoletransferase [Clostridia bacterium]MBR1705060.1 adenosylcobinamide-GDP ribazoletransferase [Clostridia bacterium]
MKTFWETILVTFGMYSRVPVKQVEWTEQNRKYSMLAFPLVGVVLGALWFLVALIGDSLGLPTVLTGALLTGLPLLVVGGIHLDGYADTCDALSSHGDKEKKLAIMKDPHVGSFAVMHVAVYLILWFAACTVLAGEDVEVWAVCALCFVYSRTLSGRAVASFPVAAGSGLVKAFADDADKKKVKTGSLVLVVVLSVLMILIDVSFETMPAAIFALVVANGVLGWYKYIANKHFGGINGDLAGWFLCKAELYMLVAAAVAVCL